MLRSLTLCALAGLAWLLAASPANAQVRVVGPRVVVVGPAFRPAAPRVIAFGRPRLAARVRIGPAFVSPGVVGPTFVGPTFVGPPRLGVVGGFVTFP